MDRIEDVAFESRKEAPEGARDSRGSLSFKYRIAEFFIRKMSVSMFPNHLSNSETSSTNGFNFSQTKRSSTKALFNPSRAFSTRSVEDLFLNKRSIFSILSVISVESLFL